MKKSFTPLIILTTAATYLLIFVGGLVRVSGAGLGCPDWPKCFGRWIPPTNVSELPDDIAPESFNLVLAWIEYVNRLVGVVIGLLILLTYIVAVRYFRKHRGLLVATTISLILVGFQGWLGGRVVASELAPWIVSVHMAAAVLLVSLLIFAAQKSWYIQREVEPAEETRGLRRLVGIVWLLTLVQIIVGADQRGTLEVLRRDNPLATDLELFNVLGLVKYAHFILATSIVVTTAMLLKSMRGLKLRKSIRFGIFALPLLVALQILVGFGMGHFGLVPLLQLLHLWIGTIFVGLAMSLYFAVPVRIKGDGVSPIVMARLAMPTAALMCCLLLTGVAVIHQAEVSRGQLPAYRNIPEFKFTSHNNVPFGDEQFIGKISVVDFFFTRCPKQCPEMTLEMRKLYHQCDGSDKVQFISISVDAEYDTPEILAEYAKKYEITEQRWAFLNGEQAAVDTLCETGFAIGTDNPLHHSPMFILIDQEGAVRGYYNIYDDNAMKRLREHIALLAQRG